ncbi:MAG: hypothetical protein JST28_22250 [Acidobacteria bacterium]|nr:hypothetical protein [Acidobacteriota bacterium]
MTLAACLAGGPSVISQKQTPSKEQPSINEQIHSSPEVKPSGAPVPAAPRDNSDPGKSRNRSNGNSDPWFERPDWIGVILTALYVAVSAFTFGAIYFQVREMRRQRGLMARQLAALENSPKSSRALSNKLDEAQI